MKARMVGPLFHALLNNLHHLTSTHITTFERRRYMGNARKSDSIRIIFYSVRPWANKCPCNKLHQNVCELNNTKRTRGQTSLDRYNRR